MNVIAPAISKKDVSLLTSQISVPKPSIDASALATVDVLIDDKLVFELGGIAFEIIAIPGAETNDSLIVWLPQHRICLTGNLFGCPFGHFPNLVTIRGESETRVQGLGIVVGLAGGALTIGIPLLATGSGVEAQQAWLIAFALSTNAIFAVMHVLIGALFFGRALALVRGLRSARRDVLAVGGELKNARLSQDEMGLPAVGFSLDAQAKS